jgi:hypothetical protein
MQPRNHNHRHGLIATLPLALLLAACAAAAPATTPTPTPTATVTATPTLIPTPSPTAVPTPTPGPPLAVLIDSSGNLKVVNGQGVEQWGLTKAAQLKIFGLSANDPQATNFNIGAVVAGSNIYLQSSLSGGTSGNVAVLTRSGMLLGLSTTTPPTPAGLNGVTMVYSPGSPEWAWLVDQSPADQINNSGYGATYHHHGVIIMGGLNEPNRTVYHWLAPAGNVENLDSWTTAGLIIHREQYTGVDCNIFYQPGSAWFALNPHTGTLTQIADGNKVALLAASSNDIVAAPLSYAYQVLINGVTYSESRSQVTEAYISPDGALVAVDRYSQTRCDLNADSGENTVELVSVASKNHVDLQNLDAIAWLGNTEFVVRAPDSSTWLYSLTGKPIADICPVNSIWDSPGGGYTGSLG